MRVGQKLQVRNSDDLLHNVHSSSAVGNSFNVGQPKAGMLFEFTPRTEEAMVKLGCDIHSWMTTYVGVVSHPYFAVTDTQGAFAIRSVPPARTVSTSGTNALVTSRKRSPFAAGRSPQSTMGSRRMCDRINRPTAGIREEAEPMREFTRRATGRMWAWAAVAVIAIVLTPSRPAVQAQAQTPPPAGSGRPNPIPISQASGTAPHARGRSTAKRAWGKDNFPVLNERALGLPEGVRRGARAEIRLPAGHAACHSNTTRIRWRSRSGPTASCSAMRRTIRCAPSGSTAASRRSTTGPPGFFGRPLRGRRADRRHRSLRVRHHRLRRLQRHSLVAS